MEKEELGALTAMMIQKTQLETAGAANKFTLDMLSSRCHLFGDVQRAVLLSREEI